MSKRRVFLFIVTVMLIAMLTSVAFAQGEPETETDFLQLILDVLGGLLDLVTGLVGWLLEQLRLFFEWILQAIQGLINLIGDLLNGLWQGLQLFLSWIGEAIGFLLRVLGEIFGWVISLARAVWDFIIWAIRNVIEVVEILGILLQIVIALVGLALNWLWQIFTLISGIFAVLQGATPSAIPGLPQCVSAPLDHELCAVWYIFEYTLFDGLPGDVILSIGILYIDLCIIFYVVREVYSLSRIVKEVFSSVV